MRKILITLVFFGTTFFGNAYSGEYVVQKGDTLSEVYWSLIKMDGYDFRFFCLSIEAFAKSNGIEDVDLIRPGDKIYFLGQEEMEKAYEYLSTRDYEAYEKESTHNIKRVLRYRMDLLVVEAALKLSKKEANWGVYTSSVFKCHGFEGGLDIKKVLEYSSRE